MSFLASLRALGGARGRLAEALAAAPGFVAPAKLSLAEVPGMGLGVVAAEPLAAGEAVLRVPQTLWRPFRAEHALEQARTRAPPFVVRVEQLAAQMAAQGVEGAAKLVRDRKTQRALLCLFSNKLLAAAARHARPAPRL
jgi:hypothetical protein